MNPNPMLRGSFRGRSKINGVGEFKMDVSQILNAYNSETAWLNIEARVVPPWVWITIAWLCFKTNNSDMVDFVNIILILK